MMSRNGVRVSYLGADLPFDDLASACQVLGPGAVLLSVTRSAIYDLHRTQLAQMLRKLRGEMQFYIGGQGVPPSDVEVQQAGAYLTAPGTPLNDVISEILGTVRAAKPRLYL
jgi:methanogenic corrinoid protein MtbC1